MKNFMLKRRAISLAAAALLCACSRSEAQKDGDQTWMQDLKAAQVFSHTAPPAQNSECLGRLVFDVDREVAWPTYYHPGKVEQWGSSFSLNVHESDSMSLGQVDAAFGQVQIAVLDVPSPEVLKEIKLSLPSERL